MAAAESLNLRRRWTADELDVLVALFFANDFSIGDDARPECHLIADVLHRSPSAIDRQWRNVDDVCREKAALNVGKGVRHAVHVYLQHPRRARAYAQSVCDRRGWPLGDLLGDIE